MPSKYKKFQRLIIALSSLIIIILIILYPKQSLLAALKGLNTWLNIVLPALLPFFIVSEIMIELGIVDFLATLLNPIMKPVFNCPGHSSFVWIMSITSGYPMGAKLIASLYDDDAITEVEAQRMLAFCNTSGPLFMIGAVGIGMLGSQEAGKIIAISHYSAALLLGVLFRFYGRKESDSRLYTPQPNIRYAFKELINSESENNKSLGIILGDSVRNSMQAQLLIGGFIILFSVIINIIIQNSSSHSLAYIPVIQPLGAGILEMTTGCQQISETMLTFENKLIATSFIIGWGGFSIHSQAISLLANTDFSMGLYFLSKLLHGILSALISYIFILFYQGQSIPTFSPSPQMQNITMSNTFMASLQLLGSAIFSILALFLFAVLLRIIKNQSN